VGHASPNVTLAWLFMRTTVASAIVGPESPSEFIELIPATDIMLDHASSTSSPASRLVRLGSGRERASPVPVPLW
jgi:aryl-alcohol dehydrogenase-like predicted oxidoreductase